jgi:predicted nucleic acid-binding protein
VILDTTVLVDLQRELRRGATGPAISLLERSDPEPARIAFVTWMEFAEGYADERREDCDSFLSAFEVLWPDTEIAWLASRIARQLQAEGRAIGDHDAWIAAFASRSQETLVTRNVAHFNRVAGLRTTGY